ncbi:hypothetical protein QAD02_008074 [Eretmocerus hayati]|uniref:Uncharacterized protein n=1 Tax=Eretmocerus hayati TaxID=131215 RepID=A0ACC2N5R0_9HYME|nr:hypothetical protein QAD02_008074 [Eretmocerus hayati]
MNSGERKARSEPKDKNIDPGSKDDLQVIMEAANVKMIKRMGKTKPLEECEIPDPLPGLSNNPNGITTDSITLEDIDTELEKNEETPSKRIRIIRNEILKKRVVIRLTRFDHRPAKRIKIGEPEKSDSSSAESEQITEENPTVYPKFEDEKGRMITAKIWKGQILDDVVDNFFIYGAIESFEIFVQNHWPTNKHYFGIFTYVEREGAQQAYRLGSFQNPKYG